MKDSSLERLAATRIAEIEQARTDPMAQAIRDLRAAEGAEAYEKARAVLKSRIPAASRQVDRVKRRLTSVEKSAGGPEAVVDREIADLQRLELRRDPTLTEQQAYARALETTEGRMLYNEKRAYSGWTRADLARHVGRLTESVQRGLEALESN